MKSEEPKLRREKSARKANYLFLFLFFKKQIALLEFYICKRHEKEAFLKSIPKQIETLEKKEINCVST
jgi:hypothetical protein